MLHFHSWVTFFVECTYYYYYFAMLLTYILNQNSDAVVMSLMQQNSNLVSSGRVLELLEKC